MHSIVEEDGGGRGSCRALTGEVEMGTLAKMRGGLRFVQYP